MITISDIMSRNRNNKRSKEEERKRSALRRSSWDEERQLKEREAARERMKAVRAKAAAKIPAKPAMESRKSPPPPPTKPSTLPKTSPTTVPSPTVGVDTTKAVKFTIKPPKKAPVDFSKYFISRQK